jgi:hypothetical protein
MSYSIVTVSLSAILLALSCTPAKAEALCITFQVKGTMCTNYNPPKDIFTQKLRVPHQRQFKGMIPPGLKSYTPPKGMNIEDPNLYRNE